MYSKRLSSAILILLFFCSTACAAQKPSLQSKAAITQAAVTPAPPLTEEKAFLYFLAITGTSADNAVARFAAYFDNSNYIKAMADEFQRASYLKRMTSTLADRLSKVDFRDKFTFEGPATFGEYSFDTHSFPLVLLPDGQFYSTILSTHFFRARDVVNKREFNWSIPMPEAEANALIKAQTSTKPGEINRSVLVKFTYSIMNWMIKVNATPISSAFAPYVHSIEIDATVGQRRQLALLKPTPGTPITAFLPETRQAAQSATNVIGKYRYTADCRDNQCNDRVVGTITLTDVGVELSGEKKDGRVKPSTRRFLDAFAVNRDGSTRLWRAESTGSFGDHHTQVVWRPFETFRHEAQMEFRTIRERDQFWQDLTVALKDWASKYPQFMFVKLDIDQNCEDAGSHTVPCVESKRLDESANAGVRGSANNAATKAMASDENVYSAGDDIQTPVIISQMRPSYTPEAKQAGIEGKVLIEGVVQKDGAVTDLKVIKGLGYGLDEAAKDAVRGFRFKPATRNGYPVKTKLGIEMTFSLH